MRPHGRIDPAPRAVVLQNDIMQRLAHAVQALELKGVLVPGHLQNRRHGMRVMRGELRINPVRHAQQTPRIGDIAHIGRGFGGEDREPFQPLNLRQLDLGVPIGPLDQPHHNAPVALFGQIMQELQHRATALAKGLHHNAQPVPSGEPRIAHQPLDQVHRDRQPVGFFRVDIQPHVAPPRHQRQIAQAGIEMLHHPVLLRLFIAWMQSRELDRNPGVPAHIPMGAAPGNRLDRAAIGGVIAHGIGVGARRLAQHVVAIGEPLGLHPGGPFHRRLNVFAQHELPPHLLHGAAHGGADHRLSQPFHGGAQMAHRSWLRILAQHLAGQHQRPCGGIDQRRGGMAHMAAPVRRRDLVLDQRIDGLGVGHAQQRLGQTHQRHTLIG